MIESPVRDGRTASKLRVAPQTLIDDDLAHVERILQQALTPYRSQFGPMVKHLNQYRGKRLRPTLLLLVAHSCGKVAPPHYILSAVVEMIHNATLVHDDVLDQADTRRHVRTVNAVWGNKASILLGDLLFTNAFHLSSTVGDAKACEWIGEATNRVCAGELRQTLESGNLELSEADYYTIIDGKTAALTECCGRLGAIYADADAAIVQSMADFGKNLGMAFQIADDVLDLVGVEQTAGKTLGSDLAQRKLTLPVIYLLQGNDGREEYYRELAAGGHASHLKLVAELRNRGAIDQAQERAEQFAETAAAALQGLPESPYRAMLESICGWSVRRDA